MIHLNCWEITNLNRRRMPTLFKISFTSKENILYIAINIPKIKHSFHKEEMSSLI